MVYDAKEIILVVVVPFMVVTIRGLSSVDRRDGLVAPPLDMEDGIFLAEVSWEAADREASTYTACSSNIATASRWPKF